MCSSRTAHRSPLAATRNRPVHTASFGQSSALKAVMGMVGGDGEGDADGDVGIGVGGDGDGDGDGGGAGQ